MSLSSSPLAAFEKAFGGPESTLESGGDMMLHGGKCKTAEQARAVAALLKSNTKIEKWSGGVYLYGNDMGDANGMILAEALKTNTTVKEIQYVS